MDLQKVVASYQKSKSTIAGKKLFLCLFSMAEKIVEVAGAERRCVYAAMERVDGYDPQKGKAFNYFVTIMVNHLRQEYRHQKKQKDLEKKYKFMEV